MGLKGWGVRRPPLGHLLRGEAPASRREGGAFVEPLSEYLSDNTGTEGVREVCLEIGWRPALAPGTQRAGSYRHFELEIDGECLTTSGS